MTAFLAFAMGAICMFALSKIAQAQADPKRKFFFSKAGDIPLLTFSDDLHHEDNEALKEFIECVSKKKK